MHVALVANSACLDEELRQFRGLVVGLLDESVRVAQILPDRFPATDVAAFGQVLPFSESTWFFARRPRLNRLAGPLEKLGVDLLHALDGGMWRPVLELGETLNLPVVLEISASQELPLIERLLSEPPTMKVALIATTQPLADAARELVDEHIMIECIRPGVHRDPKEHVGSPNQDAVCAVISGSTTADNAYKALFAAMQEVIRLHPQMQFFLSTHGETRHDLWQSAQRFGLLSNLSMVPRRLGHDEMLLGADALIQPQALGRTRGLTLGAMAHGLPILAAADPWLDYLNDDRTAWVVPEPDVDRWIVLLRRLIEDIPACRRLGASARDWISEHHKLSQQVQRTLDLYTQLVGESIPFPTQR